MKSSEFFLITSSHPKNLRGFNQERKQEEEMRERKSTSESFRCLFLSLKREKKKKKAVKEGHLTSFSCCSLRSDSASLWSDFSWFSCWAMSSSMAFLFSAVCSSRHIQASALKTVDVCVLVCRCVPSWPRPALSTVCPSRVLHPSTAPITSCWRSSSPANKSGSCSWSSFWSIRELHKVLLEQEQAVMKPFIPGENVGRTCS